MSPSKGKSNEIRGEVLISGEGTHSLFLAIRADDDEFITSSSVCEIVKITITGNPGSFRRAFDDLLRSLIVAEKMASMVERERSRRSSQERRR